MIVAPDVGDMEGRRGELRSVVLGIVFTSVSKNTDFCAKLHQYQTV